MSRLKITQTKSVISEKQNQRDTLRTLGLKKIGQSTVRDDSPQVRGMIRTVNHLVAVEEHRLDALGEEAALEGASNGGLARA